MVWFPAIAGLGTALGLFHFFRPRPQRVTPVRIGEFRPKQPGEPLRLITLNLAHGRGDRMLPAVHSRAWTERRLTAIGELLRRHAPDIVALQEVDDRAFWSGWFSHAEHLARELGMAALVHARHVNRPGAGYGTALLVNLPVVASSWGRFTPAPATFSKGWSHLALRYPDGRAGRVEVISVHLDFLRGRRREVQARELVNAFADCPHSMILMGDLNCGPDAREQTLDILRQGLDLEAYAPADAGIVTYPRTRRRLDWILVSRDLSFHTHAVLPGEVSDHRAVFAVVGAPDPAAGHG